MINAINLVKTGLENAKDLNDLENLYMQDRRTIEEGIINKHLTALIERVWDRILPF